MIARLEQGKSRRLALLLFMATMLLLMLAIALPAISMNRHYDERIEGMNNQLAIYQRVARHSDQYEAKFQQLQQIQGQDRRYLQSESESLATAELQRIVKQVIAANQGEILSTQVIQSGEEKGFVRISIRIRMKSRLQALVKIFHALESRTPYLFVENATVRSRQVARRRLSSSKEIEKAISQLDVDFQISGYMRSRSS